MRGNSDEQDKAELLVFGYACKLFRDDEKAVSIDAGSHLIPWMGDDSLKIDRYDGRGTLYDLAAYEPKESYPEILGEEEVALEQLCDEERYRSLYINEEEELTYKEEEAKRQHQQSQNYGEVAYSYETPATPVEESQEVPPSTARPFVPLAELQIPPDMTIPKTAKHNAIIERTALFLAQQGPQMEILMKVKQQGNKNFDFLSHSDSLHSYYLHLKSLIKSGSYVPREQEIDEEDVGDTEDDDGNYLHPSLITARTTTASTSGTPTISTPTATDDKQKTPKPPPTDNNSPPDFVQKIIEVMVKFVIKNGSRFETVIMKKGDVRFSFLNPRNPYNAFYKQQLDKKQKEIEGVKLPKPKVAHSPKETKSESGHQDSKPSLKRKPLPVSFSIKKPKESEGLEVPSALPVEESSDDEEGSTSPKPSKAEEPAAESLSATLEKRLKKSSESSKKSRNKKDAVLQNERKIKVAQFLKDLKKKN